MKRQWLFLSLLASLALGLSSCYELTFDLNSQDPNDIQLRSGITGTRQQPGTLNPFKSYDLVMAVNEDRYLQIVIPQGWYWKLYLTAVSTSNTQIGHLRAEILGGTSQWTAVPQTTMSKDFELNQSGLQAVLGAANPGPDQPAILRLSQSGPPIRVTLQSEISATPALLGPDLPNQQLPSN